jgi:hypothetical protein
MSIWLGNRFNNARLARLAQDDIPTSFATATFDRPF